MDTKVHCHLREDNNTDTYAALLYKCGKKVEAQTQAKRAIAPAKAVNQDPNREKKGYDLIDYSETKKLLDKIKVMK